MDPSVVGHADGVCSFDNNNNYCRRIGFVCSRIDRTGEFHIGGNGQRPRGPAIDTYV